MPAVWPEISDVDQRLAPFEKRVFAAVLKSFEQRDNPMRTNNFATGLRELSRIVLDRLASERQIKGCRWFRQELDALSRPIITRAQRIKYAVQAGLSDDFVVNTLQVDVDETIAKFAELIKELNKFTHVGHSTFEIDAVLADELAQKALKTFTLLFETIDGCRSEVANALESAATDALSDELIKSTIEALDQIATHYYIDGANVDGLKLKYMGPDEIKFEASGSVDCVLQYGSDGDYRRGDGVRVNDSYPFTCELTADTAEPLRLQVDSLRVDNSSFYE